MSDLSLLCDGYGSPEYDCQCAVGGWRGEAATEDAVKVTGSSVVFWVYNPDRGFHPMSRFSAVPNG